MHLVVGPALEARHVVEDGVVRGGILDRPELDVVPVQRAIVADVEVHLLVDESQRDVELVGAAVNRLREQRAQTGEAADVRAGDLRAFLVLVPGRRLELPSGREHGAEARVAFLALGADVDRMKIGRDDEGRSAAGGVRGGVRGLEIVPVREQAIRRVGHGQSRCRRWVTGRQGEGGGPAAIPEGQEVVGKMPRLHVVAAEDAPASLLAQLALDRARIGADVVAERAPAECAVRRPAAVELEVADGVGTFRIEPVVFAELGRALVDVHHARFHRAGRLGEGADFLVAGIGRAGSRGQGKDEQCAAHGKRRGAHREACRFAGHDQAPSARSDYLPGDWNRARSDGS